MIRRYTRSGFLAHVHALMLALVLVLQTGLGAYAAGAMPAGPMLDIFGNPLCLTDPAHAEGNAGDHHGLPNCCTFGCLAGAFTPAPPAGTSIASPRADIIDIVQPALDAASASGLPDLASHPRGPPTLT